jgi:hypothetical protein
VWSPPAFSGGHRDTARGMTVGVHSFPGAGSLLGSIHLAIPITGPPHLHPSSRVLEKMRGFSCFLTSSFSMIWDEKCCQLAIFSSRPDWAGVLRCLVVGQPHLPSTSKLRLHHSRIALPVLTVSVTETSLRAVRAVALAFFSNYCKQHHTSSFSFTQSLSAFVFFACIHGKAQQDPNGQLLRSTGTRAAKLCSLNTRKTPRCRVTLAAENADQADACLQRRMSYSEKGYQVYPVLFRETDVPVSQNVGHLLLVSRRDTEQLQVIRGADTDI